MDKELLKGSVDIILLSIIGRRDTYGYEMIQQLNELSDGSYAMSQGTLYPALKRLEKKGYLTSYWVENETSGRRKFYSLTQDGLSELDEKLQSWNRIHLMIQSCGKAEFA